MVARLKSSFVPNSFTGTWKPDHYGPAGYPVPKLTMDAPARALSDWTSVLKAPPTKFSQPLELF